MIKNKGALAAKRSASLCRNHDSDKALPDSLEAARLRPPKNSTFLKPTLSILLAALAVVAVSCKVGPNYVTPGAGVAGQWMENSTITNRPFNAAEDYWWRNFDDPVLNQLVETAFRNNRSLQAAGVRILAARAQLNEAVGNLFPQQQGISGQANYSWLNSKNPAVGADLVTEQILFAATWEIDFWGKYRRGIESDRASFLGSIAAYDDALVTLIADVAGSYVNIRTLEEQLNVAAKNVATQKESLRIARAQFKAGETSERDVQQATAQLAQTEAQIPQLEQALAQTKDGLAVLLGETPDQIARRLTGGPGLIPTAPAQVAVGIPRDLLRRRPDVREAGLAAASQSALIGVARASMYPAFSLSGEFGVAGNNAGKTALADMFNWQSRAINTGAGFVFPVFNYGRLVNQVRVQDAQFQQAVLNYQNTVLQAQQEVEDGLAAFAGQQRVVTRLTEAAAAARRSTDLAMIQYKGGQTDYTTVLSAEQAQLAVEDALASARGGVVQGIVSVYRALGGGWQIREGHDVVSDEVKAEMSRRTDWGRMLEASHHLPETPLPEVTARAKDGK
jgi:NodT family efflux transporter outer membrane factor (OMF) lipoprotein